MKRALLTAAAVGIFVVSVRVGGDDPNPYAHAAIKAASVELVQGRGVVWWSRRAVQARKDANARARTVRILRGALRARVGYQPRRSLASARAPGLVSAFVCIHGYEGAWGSDTGNGYHGGLQMDLLFESTYGPEFVRQWGDAENWPPFVQIAVAMRAYLSGRGFAPWPNTARACGLR